MCPMRRLLQLSGLAFLFFVGGCNDNSSALKALVGPYSVTIERADLAGQMDPDVMTVAVGKSQTMLLLFEVGISTDAMGPNPNGLISRLEGMDVKLENQPAHIDHSTGKLDGSLTGDGTITPDGSAVTINLHFVPTNFAIPNGGTSLEYTISGGKMP